MGKNKEIRVIHGEEDKYGQIWSDEEKMEAERQGYAITVK